MCLLCPKLSLHTPVLILDYSRVTWGVLDELAIGLRRGSKEVGKPDSCDIQFHSGLNAPVHLENLVCILVFLTLLVLLSLSLSRVDVLQLNLGTVTGDGFLKQDSL